MMRSSWNGFIPMIERFLFKMIFPVFNPLASLLFTTELFAKERKDVLFK